MDNFTEKELMILSCRAKNVLPELEKNQPENTAADPLGHNSHSAGRRRDCPLDDRSKIQRDAENKQHAAACESISFSQP